MAIMEQTFREIERGFEKGIEEGSLDVVLDMVQSSQYQFPFKSTMRETVSNALDAIKERDMAKKILLGQAKVSDFYEDREGDIYKNSRFTPEYYELEWLSEDPNVYIRYVVGSNMEKDKITITDYGVGLGGLRLEKYFSIGFSTKRLMRIPLGKFGVGSKSPLSMNDYFTIESRYNGKKYRFNVYTGKKVESIVGKFNLETGESNGEDTLPNGYHLYYENTTELNGITIIIEAKKAYKNQIEEVVESQLLYFDNVKLLIEENGHTSNIDFHPTIIYEDDNIIMSDSNYYSKPHILVNKVNYGYVNFEELELVEKSGNIGLKVQPEDIEVHPSRESLIWKDKTKKMVGVCFQRVVDLATRFIEKELQDSDFLRWLKTCYSLAHQGTFSGTYRNFETCSKERLLVERLSNVIDLASIEPVFSGTSIKYAVDLFYFIPVHRTSFKKTRRKNLEVSIIQRTREFSVKDDIPIVVVDTNSSNRKDKYLLSLYPTGFYRVKAPIWRSERGLTMSKEEVRLRIESNSDYLYPSHLSYSEESPDIDNLIKESNSIWEAFIASKDLIFYDQVIVPDSFRGTEEEEEEVLSSDEDSDGKLSEIERRKLKGTTLIHIVRWQSCMLYKSAGKLLEWEKKEVSPHIIDDWDEPEIYYGNDSDTDTLELVALLTRPSSHNDPLKSWAERFDGENTNMVYYRYLRTDSLSGNERYPNFTGANVKLFKVAQQNTKLYKDFKHIQKFFHEIKDNRIIMSKELVKWNTARQLRTKLWHLNFLWNYFYDPEKQLKFHNLVDYVEKNYRAMNMFKEHSALKQESVDTLIEYLEKVQDFQLFVRTTESPEEIAKVALSLWKTDTIEGAEALDIDVWDEYNELFEWSLPINPILNEITLLTGLESPANVRFFAPDKRQNYSPVNFSEQLDRSIVGFLKFKGII